MAPLRPGSKPGERGRETGVDRRAVRLYVSVELLEMVDRRRGRENRSAYVERILRDLWASREFVLPPPSSATVDNREFFGLPRPPQKREESAA